MEMKDQRFGIEIELTGLSRLRAAQVMAEYFGTPVSHDGGYTASIPSWTAKAAGGRS